jgi:hypothetical protein
MRHLEFRQIGNCRFPPGSFMVEEMVEMKAFYNPTAARSSNSALFEHVLA